MFVASLALLLVAASGAARAATPVVLPPGEVAATWAEPLNLADLRVGAAGSGTWVELVDRGETWAVRVRSATGRLDEAVVPEPHTAAEREDVAWLARSLLAPPSAVSSWDDVAALEAPAARASNVGAGASGAAAVTPTKGAAQTTQAVTTSGASPTASKAPPASNGVTASTTAASTKATAQTSVTTQASTSAPPTRTTTQTTPSVTTAATPTKTTASTPASATTSTKAPTTTSTTSTPASAPGSANPTSTSTRTPTTTPTTGSSAPTNVAIVPTTAPTNAATPATPTATPTTASTTPATPTKPAPATAKAPTAKASRTSPTAVTSTPPAVPAPTSAPPTSSAASAPASSTSPVAIATDPERRTATTALTGPRPYAHADGGVGWRPDATLAPRVGLDAGVRIPLASLGVTVGAGAAWTPRRALAVGEGSEQVEAVDATARLGLRVPVALSPTVAVFGGASVRSYLADGTAVVTAPVPVAGLDVSVHVPLIFGFSLAPSVGVQTDLRPVSVAIGAESAGALSPVELSAGLGLGWSQKD